MKVYVNYLFVFDPAETWGHMYELDSDLGKFLKEKGLDADLADGNTGTKVLLISKATPKVPATESKKKLQLEKKRRGYDGKYI